MPVTTHYWYVHVTEGNSSAIFSVSYATVFLLDPDFRHITRATVTGDDTLTFPWVTLRGRRFEVVERLRNLAANLISHGMGEGVEDGNLYVAQLNHTYIEGVLEVTLGMGYTVAELTPLFQGIPGLMDSVLGAPFDGHRLVSLCDDCKWKNSDPLAHQISLAGGLQYLCLEDHRSPLIKAVNGSYKVIEVCGDYTLLERPTRFKRTPVI